MTQQNNEFDKWYEENWALYANYVLVEKAWQAATAESDKRIAELKAEIAGYHLNYKDVCLENLDLKAHINILREALEIARDYQFDAVNQFHNDFSGYKDEKHKQYDYDLKLVENAIAATPAQSLQTDANEVIEQVVTLLKDSAWDDGIIDMRIDDVIEEVRKLKGK